MHGALLHTYQDYADGTKEVSTPICDADKKILKHNTRKHALFDMAYRFCDDLFDLEPANKERVHQMQQRKQDVGSSQQALVQGLIMGSDVDTPMGSG